MDQYEQLFEQAVANHSDMVTQLICLHLYDAQEAEDCWQDVFFDLFKKPQLLEKGDPDVKYWLIRVTINRCINRNKSRARRNTVSLESLEGAPPVT